MEVKIIHYEKNNWRIYPDFNSVDDYYLNVYSSLFEAKLYVNANFYTIKKQECFLYNCNECKPRG